MFCFDVCIVEKDVCPCASGPLMRVGRIDVWGKVDEIVASGFFLPVSGRGMKRKEMGDGCLMSS